MNAIETQAKAQASAAPLPLTLAAGCCPECCSDEECAATDTPCC